MAVYNLENYLEKDGLGFPLNFRRGNPNPLDNSAVWNDFTKMKAYAESDPTAYVGQVLSLVESVVVDAEAGTTSTVVTVYSIQDEVGTLKKVGTSPVGDEGTITVADDGTVSLYGIAGLALEREEEDGSKTAITYQPLYVNGKLTWVEPSATTVEGLATEIEGLKARLTAVETVVGKAATDTDDATGLVKDVADNAAAIAAEKTAREEADKTNKDAIDAVSAKIGTVAEDKTLVEMIADAQDAATYDDTELVGRVEALENDHLKGDDKTELQGNINTLQQNVANTYETKDDASDKLAEAKSYAEEKATAAQTAATESAATDATTKANKALDDAKAYADGKVASVTASDNSVAVGGTTTAPTVAAKISQDADNALTLAEDGLKVVIPAAAEYSVVKDENAGEFAAVYHLTKDGVNVGASINIPKDMVVESGAIVVNPDGQVEGTYIELKLQNVDEPLYINVGSLIEYVTSGSQTGDMVVVSVSDDHKVTATITDGSITLNKLATDVQTAIGKAHSHENEAVLNGITADKVEAWDAAESNAKTYAEEQATAAQTAAAADATTKANKALDDAKAYADGKDAETLGTAKTYAEEQATAAQNAATADATTKANKALDDAKSYADGKDAETLGTAKTYAEEKATAAQTAAAADATTKANKALDDAKAYADGKDAAMDTRVKSLEDVGAEKNVINSVDTTQFNIDENRNLTLLEIAMGKVTGLQDALEGKVDKIEGYRLISPDESTKLGKLVLNTDGTVEVSGEVNASNVKELDSWITTNRDTVPGLLSVADATLLANLKDVEAGAEVNDIVAITVAGSETALPIVDKKVNIPGATAEQAGVVLGSTAENKISVAADYTMEVNSLNVNKLVQSANEYIILNGGTSSSAI